MVGRDDGRYVTAITVCGCSGILAKGHPSISISLMHLSFHALQTIGLLLCMRMTLLLNQKSERTRQVEDWNGEMGLVTEEKWASGCEGKVLVNAAYLIDDDNDTW